ncbi:MAG: hypothetical protein CBD62_03270 [Candidatus Pelagibacter sp. TMED202]|nr:MAG: hypothetical protein CBD62_03270 [Candidatus Pelagibacter sp. TMED202]
MNNLRMFCLSLNPDHLKLIKKINYTPVGLGEANFSEEWMSDKNGNNISSKNQNYGEYTFHYWLWKNYLDQINSDWVGFCQYRKFFLQRHINQKDISFNALDQNLVKSIPSKLTKIDCILGEKSPVDNYRFKFYKKNFIKIILSPSVIFFRKKRSIKFHFDVFHGEGNLDLAIDLLEKENRDSFRDFVNSKTSFNPHNMFICKKNFLRNYYESVFPWLKKCEDIFGFKKLEGYGMKRIYGFLAERYLSYWFQKYSNVVEYPILFKDLSDYRNF